MAGIIGIYPHYVVDEIRTLRQVFDLFREGYEAKNNWLFLSTQGTHGTHLTLDELEEEFASGDKDRLYVTILIVQPRLCNLLYGDVLVAKKDIPRLREIVRKTLKAIPPTQKGNI